MPKKSAKKRAAASSPEGQPELAPEPSIAAEAPKTKKTRAKKASPAVEAAAAESVQAQPEKPAKKKRAATRPRTAKIAIKDEAGAAVEVTVPVGAPVADPIGDVTDGEAGAAADELPAPSEAQAMAHALAREIIESELPPLPHQGEDLPAPAPPAKLERLQKILSQAGVASRRHAEEMIVEGRVMVNGQPVTHLGAKADPARDHIRVDGKLISGAERHRYFMLNKPRGYVTTVSDPEGRPTVMQLFEKLHQRLYPVGRLDYLSEGLLLVTNDGELANQLTRASSGVEKTYVVKIAGNPAEEDLERLRSGVAIERGRPGSERVHTAPAVIRRIREGDNPWFEVVLIEGRNRELRKMFEQIGHHVEKIRRVGYGPLVLDVEPGNFRELTPEELTALRLTAEGKMKPRRLKAALMLPKDAGKPAEEREAKRGNRKPFSDRAGRQPQREFRRDGKPDFKPRFAGGRPERSGERPQFSRPQGNRPQFSRSEGEGRGGSRQFGPPRGQGRPFRERKEFETGTRGRSESRGGGFSPRNRAERPEGEARRGYGEAGERPQFRRGGKPQFDRASKPQFEKGSKPRFERGQRPPAEREGKPQFERGSRGSFDRGPRGESSRPPYKSGGRPAYKGSGGPGFQREKKAGEGFEPRSARPASRPAGRGFGARPSGPPASRPGGKGSGSRSSSPSSPRPQGKRFSPGPSSGKKPFSNRPGKPSFRPGGKSGPRPGGRKRY